VGASFASQAARLGVIAKALPTSLWLAAGAIKCAAAPDAAVIQPRCSRCSCFHVGSPTGDLHPIYSAPMLGAHHGLLGTSLTRRPRGRTFGFIEGTSK
ncbi:MAG: hypothetical protein K8T91_08855, partial [Planctomycetes bacterium]|nr:hypothetical protein [Planctomycetota bacterium]